MKEYWKRGLQAHLSRVTDIPKTSVCEIIHRHRSPSKYAAKRLEAGAKVIGLNIPFEAWLFNKETKHPAFLGKPTRKLSKPITDRSFLK